MPDLSALADLDPAHFVAMAVSLGVALVALVGRRGEAKVVVPAAFAIAAALAVALQPGIGVQIWPDKETGWLVWIALAGGAAGVLASARFVPTAVVWVAYVAVAAFVARIAMDLPLRDGGWHYLTARFAELPGTDDGWGGFARVFWVSLVGAIVWGHLVLADRLMARHDGPGPGWTLGLLVVPVPIFTAHAAMSLSVSFAAQAVGVVVLAWVVLSRVHRGAKHGALGARGAAAPLLVTLTSIVLVSSFAGQLPWEAAVLLLVAPCGALVTELPKVRTLGHWPRAIIGLGVVAALSLAAGAVVGAPDSGGGASDESSIYGL
ncbi:MAG: hypothetical protein AAGI30_05290 [Planctomycetota bacterium]